jgi:3-phosphoglycerate kinase
MLLAEEIFQRVDHTFLAGQLAFPFLTAQGRLRGHSGVPDESVVVAERMLAAARDHQRSLHTPADYTVVERSAFERGKPASKSAVRRSSVVPDSRDAAAIA